MGSRPHSKPRVSFGPFEFDAASGDLRKHQTKLRLAGQPLVILELLLERPNEVVGRDELQQRLWNGKTFVDFEHGLNAAINKLRQTLGDSAEQPRYVETLPGRGYRFIGAVSYSSPRPVLEMVAPIPAPAVNDPVQTPPGGATSPAPRANRKWLWIAAALALLSAGVWVLVGRATPVADPIAQTMRFRIAIPPGMKLSGSQTFSLSPDGRTLVYLASAKGGPMTLWAQSLNSLEPRPLVEPRGVGDAPVFWSPDSQQVAFHGEGQLKRIDLKGNPAQVIGPVPGIVLGGTWGRDGTILFGTETSGILRIPASGGEPSAVTIRDAARSDRLHAFPVLLPDGRHFLYSRQSAIVENTGVFLGSLDAKPSEQNLTRLIATPKAAQFVTSHDGGGVVLFQRDATLWAQDFDGEKLRLMGEAERVVEPIGSTRAFGFFAASNGILVHRNVPTGAVLTWFDRRGQMVKQLGPALDYFDSPIRVSPDGTRIALTRFEGSNVDIWVHDLTRDVTQRLTFDAAIDQEPIWSPDGKRLVFSSARMGHYDLFTIGASGEGKEELLYASNENKFATSWSEDGQFLLYTTEAGSGHRNGMRVLPLTGAAKGKPLADSKAGGQEVSGVFSPDSRWIAYVSNESGQSEIYVRSFSPSQDGSGAPKTLISRGGGTKPHWSSNGKEILFRGSDGSLLSSAVATSPALRVGVPQKLFSPPGNRWDAIGNDERFLVAVPVEQSAAPFTVVVNWATDRKHK